LLNSGYDAVMLLAKILEGEKTHQKAILVSSNENHKCHF